MNIAFFTNNYKPFVGGVPIAVELLAGRLRERGHRVFVFAPDYGDESPPETDVFRCPAIKNFNESSFVLPITLTLEPYAQFADLKADVVHVHHPFLLGDTGMQAARQNDLPVVFTYHTQYEKYSHYMPFGERMVEEIAVKLSVRFANACDAIIAPSTDIRQLLLDRGVNTPIKVIPTGVDLARFKRGKGDAFRQRFGIGASEKVCLYVSRLAREKNTTFLLDAFQRIAQDEPQARMVIVGSGDEEKALKNRAAELGFGSRVVFAGTLVGDDLVGAYRGSDLFVYASTSETQGMVVLEAMAGGLTVVAVDGPGVRDIVIDGVNGCMVSEGDVEGFSARCVEILQSGELCARLRERAGVRARELSLAATTRKVESLYKSVIRNPRPDRHKRFLLLREFFRYQFQRIGESIDELLP